MKRLENRAAVSLMEVLAVIAVVGIIVSVALPRVLDVNVAVDAAAARSEKVFNVALEVAGQSLLGSEVLQGLPYTQLDNDSTASGCMTRSYLISAQANPDKARVGGLCSFLSSTMSATGQGLFQGIVSDSVLRKKDVTLVFLYKQSTATVPLSVIIKIL
jgi:hypothetical protein